MGRGAVPLFGSLEENRCVVNVVGFPRGRRYFRISYPGWCAADAEECARRVSRALDDWAPDGAKYFGGVFEELLSGRDVDGYRYDVTWSAEHECCVMRYAVAVLDLGLVMASRELDMGGGCAGIGGLSPSVVTFRPSGVLIGPGGELEKVSVFERVAEEQDTLDAGECVSWFGDKLVGRRSWVL